MAVADEPEGSATEPATREEWLESALEVARQDLGTAVRALASVVDDLAPERTLDERIAAVQAELEDVPRQGHAEVTTASGGKYTYDYILEADLMAAIRPLLAKHGIAVYYGDELLGVEAGMATVRVTMTFRANGEERACQADGVGTDKGDKHANKAKTSAVRYILWKMFLQPSDEDPEQENVSQEAARAAESARAATSGQGVGRETQARGTRQKAPETRGRLVERINKLAVELDEVQGNPPGQSIAALADKCVAMYEQGLPQLPEDELVRVGQALAAHLADQRAIADSGKTADAEFELPSAG